jgi:hypothetical protein
MSRSLRTKAAKTFLEALRVMDALDTSVSPVDWLHGFLAIEDEASVLDVGLLETAIVHGCVWHGAGGAPCAEAVAAEYARLVAEQAA